MKRKFFIPTMIFALMSFLSNAQTTTTKNNQTIVTKGYYSIGNNAEKLSSGTVLTQTVAQSFSTQKGYYGIGAERPKPSRSYKINRSDSPTPVRKGYYGIGTNAKKLN